MIDGYDYKLSDKKGKKLMVQVQNKTIYFGDTHYQHYKDRTGLLPASENHLDKKRREHYLARASKIKDKDNHLTAKDKTSPNYHAIKILW